MNDLPIVFITVFCCNAVTDSRVLYLQLWYIAKIDVFYLTRKKSVLCKNILK